MDNGSGPNTYNPNQLLHRIQHMHHWIYMHMLLNKARYDSQTHVPNQCGWAAVLSAVEYLWLHWATDVYVCECCPCQCGRKATISLGCTGSVESEFLTPLWADLHEGIGLGNSLAGVWSKTVRGEPTRLIHWWFLLRLYELRDQTLPVLPLVETHSKKMELMRLQAVHWRRSID